MIVLLPVLGAGWLLIEGMTARSAIGIASLDPLLAALMALTDCSGIGDAEPDSIVAGRNAGDSFKLADDELFAEFPVYFWISDLMTSGAFFPKRAKTGTATRHTSKMSARIAIMAELCIVVLLDGGDGMT